MKKISDIIGENNLEIIDDTYTMKKVLKICIIAFLLLTMSACQKSEFEKTTHIRSENYSAIFDMMSKTDGHLTVGVENKVWNEEKADIYFETIQSDYEKLIKAGGDKDKNINVYIVESTISGDVQVTDNAVHCTAENIENLAYRPFLTQAVFGFSQRWQREGLSDYIFGETQEKTDEEIKSYCQNDANQGILSLIPPYFSEDFATDTQIKFAKSAALSLTKYTLENLGMEEYLKTDNYSALLQPWLKNIGLTEIVAEDYSFSDRIKEDYSNSEYPMTLIVDNMYFYLEPRQWAENADQLYDFFRRNVPTVDDIKENLHKHGLANYIKEFENEYVHVYISEVEGSKARPYHGNKISLSHASSFGHEIVHIFIPEISNDANAYLSEGIAQYFGILSEEKYYLDAEDNQIRFQEFVSAFKDVDLENIEEKNLGAAQTLNEMRKYYSYSKSLPKTIDEFDLSLYFESAGIVSLMNEHLRPGSQMFIPISEIAGLSDNLAEYEGNHLSYVEAQVFVAYLIDTYDALTVADVTSGKKSFEEGFGKDYDTVFAEFMKVIEKKYKLCN